MTSQEALEEVATSAPRSVAKKLIPWLAIVALLVLEYVVFAQTVRREVAWFIPTGYDQCVYLECTYGVYEKMLADGVGPGIVSGLQVPQPNGALFHVAAALLCLVLGPSRLTVLTVNFSLFACFQCGLAGTLRWYSSRWSIAWFGLGLLLAASTPFFCAGGLFDARLDLGAFCLYGTFTCAVVRSRLFASRPWAVAIGLTAITLALYRHITVVYFAGIFGLCLGFFTARLLLGWRDGAARRLAGRQLTGVVVAGSLFAAALTPLLMAKFECLWNYYVVNTQLGGDRDVRAAEFGCHTLLDHCLYYARNVASVHAGKAFLALAVLAVLVALTLSLAVRRPAAQGCGPRVHAGSVAFFLSVCLVLPYAVLTYTIAKSPIVGNIMVVPLLWLALSPLLVVVRRGLAPNTRWATVALTLVALLAASGGLWLHTHRHYRLLFWRQHADDAATVLALHDEIASHSREAGLNTPLISYDCIVDFLFVPATNVRAYETHRQRLEVGQLMPANGVLAMDDAAVMNALSKSDFVVLTTATTLAEKLYPFHQQMEILRPRLRAYCDRELLHLQRYRLSGTSIDLYMRSAAGVRSEAGGRPSGEERK